MNIYKDDDNNPLDKKENEKDDSSIIGFIIESFKLNLSETISKNQRKKLLKQIFGFISGMFYCNSLFTALINLATENKKSPNFKISLKIFFYNIFNPGIGNILSCFCLFPHCSDKYERELVLSLLGIFIGLLLVICPFSLGFGTYLIKLTDKNIAILPIKITFIFIGLTGTIISFILSGINRKTILEAVKFQINPSDMIIGCGDKFAHLVSQFGWGSFFRLLANITIPGLGTLTLNCKYGCDFYIILTSILQFSGGLFFFSHVNIIINGGKLGKFVLSIYNDFIENNKKKTEMIMFFIQRYLIIFIQSDFASISQELF